MDSVLDHLVIEAAKVMFNLRDTLVRGVEADGQVGFEGCEVFGELVDIAALGKADRFEFDDVSRVLDLETKVGGSEYECRSSSESFVQA